MDDEENAKAFLLAVQSVLNVNMTAARKYEAILALAKNE